MKCAGSDDNRARVDRETGAFADDLAGYADRFAVSSEDAFGDAIGVNRGAVILGFAEVSDIDGSLRAVGTSDGASSSALAIGGVASHRMHRDAEPLGAFDEELR